MNSLQTIVLGAGVLLAYSLFRKSAAAGDLVFYPKGINALQFKSGSPILKLNLGVGNTSNQSFTINALAGNLYTNDTYIGYVSNFEGITIPPQSEGNIPVNVKMSLIGVVSTLIDGLSNGTWTQDLELSLKANVDNLVVPVTIKYKVGN